jgi:hypothetical protein
MTMLACGCITYLDGTRDLCLNHFDELFQIRKEVREELKRVLKRVRK